MEKKQKKTQMTYSLKQLLENKKEIKREHILALRKNLLAKLDMPIVEGKHFLKGKIGENISLQVKNYPLPILNLYEGCIESNNSVENLNTVYVSFNSDKGIVFAKGKLNKKNNRINLTIPQKARSGIIRFHFPATEIWGKNEREPLKQPFPEEMFECEEQAEKVFIPNKIIVILKAIGFFMEIYCTKCKDEPICTEGAIKFDENNLCYVDQLECKGQRHIHHQDDEICWNCFTVPTLGIPFDATFSDKCELGILTKTMHISPIPGCCGCCQEQFNKIDGMCLKQLCGELAIMGGNPCTRCPGQTPGETQFPYYVDPEKCTACYMCFDNTYCTKPKMKAYIKKSGHEIERTITTIIIHELNFKRIYPELYFSGRIPENPPLPYYQLNLGVWGKKDKNSFFEEYPINFNSENLVKLNKELELEGDFHLGLYYKKDQSRISVDIPGFANVQSSIKHIKPINGKFSSEVIFNSELVNFHLGYSINNRNIV